MRAALLPSSGSALVHFKANVKSMTFNPQRQTVTPTASVTFTGAQGAALKQVVNVMGRVRSCAPGATFAGYKSC